MGKYPIHPDFKRLERHRIRMNAALLPAVSFVGLVFDRFKPSDGIRETKKTILGYLGEDIKIAVYKPENIAPDAPCLIYLHGGAFWMKAAPHHKTLMYQYALGAQCVVVFVDYRLAPKYPFPYGVEDCFAAFGWVCEHAQTLGIDPHRIAVAGDSAGGALTAAVCLMARDRKCAIRPCFQMMIYPVLDSRQQTRSIQEYVDTPMWDSVQTQYMWSIYLKNGAGDQLTYAAPAQADDLHDLPPAFIEAAEFDCLHDEDVEFAHALERAGVDVQLYESVGTVHAYEFVKTSAITKASIAMRIELLKKAFEKR